MIVTPGATEPGNVISTTQDGLSGTKDQLILDDLIVDGSICVGFDCINGESFGFDTLRLKENNLRIRFYDTSNSASFPSNDWQITANDSSNGGANKFSIDDIDSGRTTFTIEAGTRANALYVDDSGRVGLGTSTPAEDLHIWYGDTPTIRLHQSGSGWAPQTWDIAGNEANFFIRDVTNGSKLPFRIKPGAPTSSIYIAADGDIGMGTDSPTHALHVKRTGNVAVKLERDGYVQNFMNATASYGNFGTINDFPVQVMVNSDWRIRFNEISNSKVLEVNSGGTTFAYSDGSDWYPASSREAKENIDSLSHDKALRALNGLNPVTYNYKTNKEEERVGFIAEDVPELVAINGRKHLNAMDIVAVLTKVVKEQQKTISELNDRIAVLETKNQTKSQ
ncbi:MAG: tail fiber domain-containing protein [Candidatus Aminicenantes bacterium]|nr:MAG: tail fiber domain-containing protein [Candidatus Aminicenantes bacterium]